MIRFSVNGQRLARQTNEQIVADSLNYLSMAFAFSGDWKGLTAWANITAPDGTVLNAIIDNGRIPADKGINLTVGTWRMMLHGDAVIGGETIKRITTNSIDIIVDKCEFGNGEPFSIDVDDATLAVAQAIAVTGDMQSLIDDVESKLDAGELNGSDGVSPTVGVTNINGGHRVSITDASGTKQFDVLDGVDGVNGRDGVDGRDGTDATVTADNISAALGYTPASETALAGKQATIADLATIRAGAAAGATALQSYTESDPTVPSWAKATSKPSYSASEIAYGDSTVGAALDGMSGGTGGGSYELVYSTTLAANASTLAILKDSSGNSLSLRKVVVEVYGELTAAKMLNIRSQIDGAYAYTARGGTRYYDATTPSTFNAVGGGACMCIGWTDVSEGIARQYVCAPAINGSGGSAVTMRNDTIQTGSRITGVLLWSSGAQLAAGMTVKVYGMR